MECKVMRLADIVPAEYNPRVTLTEADFEYKALKASIDEFGLVVPLVVNERTGTLPFSSLISTFPFMESSAELVLLLSPEPHPDNATHARSESISKNFLI